MARILVVDDNKDLLEVIREMLAEAGHTATLATDALQAAQVLEHERFDVALIDIFMPVVDGLQLLHQWRGDHPTMGLIAMSGGGTTAEGLDALTAASAFGALTLRKPIHADTLAEAITTVLPRSRRRE